jgi:predicted RNA-binding Zn-ribbon protein involved in translation (DUF1610 family)
MKMKNEKSEMIECLVCGHVGPPRTFPSPGIERPHWLLGWMMVTEICPNCGDTAIEHISMEEEKILEKEA